MEATLDSRALVPREVAWAAAAVVVLLQVANHDQLTNWVGVAACVGAVAAVALSLTPKTAVAAPGLALAAMALNLAHPQMLIISVYLAFFWMPFSVMLTLGPRFALGIGLAQTGLAIALEMRSESPDAAQLGIRGAFLLLFFGSSALLGYLLRRYGFLAKRREAELKARNELFRRALSRELHDTAVHATTAMVMRANQALLREGLDEQTRQDLQFIANTGQEATQTLRQTLAALRKSDRLPETSSADASWVKARLRGNQARLEQAGFAVRMSAELPLADVPAEIMATLGRIVTEVTNNVARHAAPGSEVSIIVENTGSALELMCVNVMGSADPEPERARLGVVGMTELAESVGGSVTAQASGEFWITRVSLPTGRDSMSR